MYDRYIDFTFDFGLCTCKLSDMPKDMMLAWTLLPIPQELKYRPYMFFLVMIPIIEKVKVPWTDGREITRWVVEGKHGWDVCDTLGRAIRYWLWHCGVPAKIAFWGVKRKNIK